MSELTVKVWPQHRQVKKEAPCLIWVALGNLSNRPVRVITLPPDGLGQNAMLPMKMRVVNKITNEPVPYVGPLYKIAVTLEDFVKLPSHRLIGYQVDLREFFRLNKGSYYVQFWYDTMQAQRQSINWGYPAQAARIWRGRTEVAEVGIDVV